MWMETSEKQPGEKQFALHPYGTFKISKGHIKLVKSAAKLLKCYKTFIFQINKLKIIAASTKILS